MYNTFHDENNDKQSFHQVQLSLTHRVMRWTVSYLST